MAAVNENTSSDEEPDYMSEEFLKQCTSNDVRPSLLHNRAEKRKHDILKRQHQANQTKTEKEKEILKSVQEALKVPISEDNKGFQMLQKMGYKPGSSIGKERNDPLRKGITAPIEIELRRGRGGLGREQHELEKHIKTLGNADEYRSRQQNAILMREILYDLKKAQFACHSLDEESGITEPVETWFWPKLNPKSVKDSQLGTDDDETNARSELDVPLKKARLDDDESETSSSDDEESVPDGEKLASIIDYLRSHYHYCLWCGTKFDNKLDIEKSCPGLAKDDH